MIVVPSLAGTGDPLSGDTNVSINILLSGALMLAFTTQTLKKIWGTNVSIQNILFYLGDGEPLLFYKFE